MDSIGSMNSLRDDTVRSTSSSKSATARRGEDQERGGAFGDLLAGIFLPPIAPAGPVIQQAVPTTHSDQTSHATPIAPQAANEGVTPPDNVAAPQNEEIVPTAASASGHVLSEGEGLLGQLTTLKASALPSTHVLATQNPIALSPTTQSAAGPTSAVQIGAPQTAPASTATVQAASAQAETVQASLVQAAPVQSPQDRAAQVQLEPVQPTPAQTETASSVTTNAATLSASRSNAGAAALENNADQSGSSEATTTPTGQTPAASPAVSNDNVVPTVLTKAKSVEPDLSTKSSNPSIAPVATTVDGAGSTSLINGQETSVPANDQANRAPQLTPHTIPTLAATMMRRFDSGSRQFTMRLDPPELGQVEVKLTVAVDKKVRAVVSADRPEALADLVRSARELTRALQEAGLDLEDNGLTFQMNDPSNGGQNHQAADHRAAQSTPATSNLGARVEAETLPTTNKAQTPSDPFERWQRARIALTV